MKKLIGILMLVLLFCGTMRAQLTIDSVNLVHLGVYEDRAYDNVFSFNINHYKGLFWQYNDNRWLGTWVNGKHVKIWGAGNKILFYDAPTDYYNCLEALAIIRSYAMNNRLMSANEVVNGLEKVVSIQPVSFIKEDTTSESTGKNAENIGFTTESVQKALPQLLEKEWTGQTVMDMSGVIPLLVNAVQCLQKQTEAQTNEITTLKAQLASNVKSRSFRKTTQVENVETQVSCLSSVYPNPFKEDFSVSYEIAQTAKAAVLRITDLSGRNMTEISIPDRGKNKEAIDGSSWAPGFYFCSLIVDGSIVDTQRISKK
jgi:hypothetical protein